MMAFGSKPLGTNVRGRVDRYQDLTARICDWLEEGPRPSLILIEGYAHGAQFVTAKLCEFGGILRYNLIDCIDEKSPYLANPILEVAPNTLKKFITGKGNSPKDQMGAHVAKRFGELFKNNDEVDAFSLWKLATCCVDNSLCPFGYQLECVHTVMGHVDLEDEEAKEDKRIEALLWAE